MMNVVGPIVGKPSNGWDVPPINFGATGADYLTRGINSVLGLTANTTTEAIYHPWGAQRGRETAEREDGLHDHLQGIESIHSGDPAGLLVSHDV